MISFPANIKAITYYYDTGANIDGSNMDVTISFADESEEEPKSHDGGYSNNIKNNISIDVVNVNSNDIKAVASNDVRIINSNDIRIYVDNDNKTGATTPLGKIADAASGGGCNVGIGIFMLAAVSFSRKGKCNSRNNTLAS